MTFADVEPGGLIKIETQFKFELRESNIGIVLQKELQRKRDGSLWACKMKILLSNGSYFETCFGEAWPCSLMSGGRT